MTGASKKIPAELARVRRAANNRAKAEREYIESMRAAREHFSLSEIGDVAGISRQNVAKMTRTRPA